MEIIKNCKGEGFFIVETYRTPEKQDILYEQGRTIEGDIITKARAWESYHNYGLALDISHTPSEVVDAFENAGFEWGGRWESFKDTPHFQMTFGLSVSDLKELYAKGGLQYIWEYVVGLSN
jgi:peptidoglycan L-alanyl-D-glutamate endopeptidase CwlK